MRLSKAKLAFLSCLFFSLVASVYAQPTMNWRGTGGWGINSHYVRLYDPKTVETFSGEVEKVEIIKPAYGMTDGVHLLVKTDGEKISVHLGPSWFIENQDIEIQPTDTVEVTGSRIKLEGKDVIIASKITKGDQSLFLRDRRGAPIWSGWRGV